MIKSDGKRRITRLFWIATAAIAGLTAAPASATQFLDVRITGDLGGAISTVQCGVGSNAACLSSFPGGSSSESFLRSFSLMLGAMNLAEGDNAFSYGYAFGSGLYSGTIANHGGVLTGRNIQFVYADASCRSGAIGCRNIVGSSASFDVVQAAVPEPATWAMMLIGFGAMGVALRRRRPAPALRIA